MNKISGLYIVTKKEEKSKIWTLEKGKIKLISELDRNINTICNHKGELYDGSRDKIFKTLEDIHGENPVAKRRIVGLDRNSRKLPYNINFLYSFEEKLYDVVYCEYGDYMKDSRVFLTLEDSNGEMPLAERYGYYPINVLYGHNGVLYDGGEGIFETLDYPPLEERFREDGIRRYFKNSRIVERKSVEALCGHDGILYDGGGEGIFETIDSSRISLTKREIFRNLISHEGELYDAGNSYYETHLDIRRGHKIGSNKIFKTLEDPIGKKPIVERSEPISTLHSHEGALYDGTINGKLYCTLEDELIYDFNEAIFAMISL